MTELETKQCNRCLQEKPLSSFGHRTRRCRKCQAEIWAENQRANGHDPAEVRREKKNLGRTLQRMGIRAGSDDWHNNAQLAKQRLAHYAAQEVEQKGLCALCAQPHSVMLNGKLTALHRDHDEDLNIWRGLLCLHCNSGLGMFRDNTVLLRAAADYLERYAAEPVEARTKWQPYKIYATYGVACEICQEQETATRDGQITRACMDHDHDNMMLRGVLDRRCNVGLSKFGDDPARLRRAADYLLRWGRPEGVSCARRKERSNPSRAPKRREVPEWLVEVTNPKRGVARYKLRDPE